MNSVAKTAANDGAARENDCANCAALRREARINEPVIASACLVSVAFRMRDERGLVIALRELSAAVEALSEVRAANDD